MSQQQQQHEPAPSFATISEALEDLRQGKFVIVMDDENRENEGDLIMCAEFATPEKVYLIIKRNNY